MKGELQLVSSQPAQPFALRKVGTRMEYCRLPLSESLALSEITISNVYFEMWGRRKQLKLGKGVNGGSGAASSRGLARLSELAATGA